MRDVHTKIVMLNKNLLSALNVTCKFSVKSAFSQISQTKQNKTLPSHYGEKNRWQNYAFLEGLGDRVAFRKHSA